MPEMNERHIAPKPYAQGSGTLPELVIFATPSDKGLVEATNLLITRARYRDASAALGVLNDGLWRSVQKASTACKHAVGVCLREVENETLKVDYVVTLLHLAENLRRIVHRHQHVVIVQYQNSATSMLGTDIEGP